MAKFETPKLDLPEEKEKKESPKEFLKKKCQRILSMFQFKFAKIVGIEKEVKEKKDKVVIEAMEYLETQLNENLRKSEANKEKLDKIKKGHKITIVTVFKGWKIIIEKKRSDSERDFEVIASEF